MTAAFVVVVTYMLGQGVEIGAHSCPTWACVEDIETRAHASLQVSRIQVWKARDYGRLSESGKFVWPPIVDWQFL